MLYGDLKHALFVILDQSERAFDLPYLIMVFSYNYNGTIYKSKTYLFAFGRQQLGTAGCLFAWAVGIFDFEFQRNTPHELKRKRTADTEKELSVNCRLAMWGSLQIDKLLLSHVKCFVPYFNNTESFVFFYKVP